MLSTALDLVLVVLVVAQLVVGWRDGFVVAALGLVGLLLGAGGALLVLPALAAVLHLGEGAPLLVLLGALVLALLGRFGLVVLGLRLRRPGRGASAVPERGAGALTAALGVLLVAWVVAGAVRVAPLPTAAGAVRDSQVLAVTDDVLAPAAGDGVTQFWAAVRSDDLPQVFSGLAREPIVPAEAPQPLLPSPGLDAAGASTVKITGVAESCSRALEGSGFVLESSGTGALVVTNAHVVAGLADADVTSASGGPRLTARVVAFDPSRDLALLDVPGLTAPALTRSPDLAASAPAVVAGFPLDGPYLVTPARVRAVVAATGRDIYGRASVTREVYSLRADVEPGNSGGPLLTPEGALVGVVFARSLDDPGTAYALTTKELDAFVAASTRTNSVSTGECVS